MVRYEHLYHATAISSVATGSGDVRAARGGLLAMSWKQLFDKFLDFWLARWGGAGAKGARR